MLFDMNTHVYNNVEENYNVDLLCNYNGNRYGRRFYQIEKGYTKA